MLTKIKEDKFPAGGTKRRASAGAGNHARMDQQSLSEKRRRKWRIRQERHRTENCRAKSRILTRHADADFPWSMAGTALVPGTVQ